MTKAILFDLDSCLSPADEPGRQLFASAFEAIRQASEGAYNRSVLHAAFEEMWRLPYDFVTEKYHFTHAMRAAGWEVLAKLEVMSPMSGYGDLDVLAELGALKFLVTSGFLKLQRSKIAALGIASQFTRIYVDAIDQPGHCGKQQIFETILRDYNLTSDQVLIVGDNHDSEIAAGTRLGIRTVQTLRPGVPRSADATFHIKDLHELKPLLLLE